MTYKVFLMGGVGNQLFQITRALSLREEGKKVIVLELGIYKNIILRFINHSIHKEWINIFKLSLLLDLKIKRVSFIDLLNLFILFILRKLSIKGNFDLPLEQRLRSKYKIDVGYFQGDYHFSKKAQNLVLIGIKKLLNNELAKISSTTRIVFHLRTGDFLFKKNNHSISRKPNFFIINKYLSSLSLMDRQIVIITDDTSTLKNINMENLNCTISSKDPKSDFIQLVHSHKMYVSQSSYCYWAYKLAKDINGCEVINLNDWVYKKIA